MVLHTIMLLGALLLLLATLPLTLELLALTAAAAGVRPEHEPAPPPPRIRLAVVIPAHNEELLIGRCVTSILASAGAAPIQIETTVLAVAHNCVDATPQNATAAGAIVLVLEDLLQTGKGSALRHGFAAALRENMDAVLAVDADSVVSPNLIASVAAMLSDGSQALQCRYEVANSSETPRTRLMALALLGMNVLRPLGRSRLGLSAGIFGNGFALSRETLSRVPYLADSLVEDLEYHLQLAEAGIRVDFLNGATVWGEMPLSGAGAATQRARWEGGRARIRREWSLRLLLGVLKGRLRLAEPLADLLALPLSMQTACLIVALALPLAWLRIYALVALLIAGAYLLVAAALGPDFKGTLRALSAAPRFFLWKLGALPAIWRAGRHGAGWVRTEREPAPPRKH